MSVVSALTYSFAGFIGMYIWVGIPYIIYRFIRTYFFQKEDKETKLVTRKGFYSITVIGFITGFLMFITAL